MHTVKAKSRELRKQHKPESFGPRFKSWWAHQVIRARTRCSVRARCCLNGLQADRLLAAWRVLDDALQFHGDTHIAFDLDFSAHKCADAIEFAVEHGL